MASPQVEDGYTRIANEIMEALARNRIPGVERQIVDLVLRKTYGFGKVWDHISNSQFCEGCLLKKQHVNRALKSIIDKRIIVTKYGDNGKVIYRFNKNYRQWKLSPKKVTVTKFGEPVTNNGSQHLLYTKETIQKKEPPISPKKAKAKKKPAPLTPCPDIFPITDKMKVYAKEKNYVASLEDLTEAFLLHHRAKGSRWADWYAAWQKWLRNQLEWYPEKNVPPGNGPRETIKPKTYAQAQDAERRQMACMVLEMEKEDAEKNPTTGTDKTQYPVQSQKIG